MTVVMREYMYPTLPELGEIPYQLEAASTRLYDLMGWAEERSLTDSVKLVYQNETKRISLLLEQAKSVVRRINSGEGGKGDTVKHANSLLEAINSGLDGLNALIGNGTALDYARNVFGDVGEGAKEAYSKVKEELIDTSDKLIGGNAPWLILILGLVLAIVIFVKR